jgi:hypothetical protein
MMSRQASLSGLLKREIAMRRLSDHVLLAESSDQCSPNTVWREKVAQWCFDVADHLSCSRSIVYVAMNALDRYCALVASEGQELMTESFYEIASLSAVFLAVRIAGLGCFQIQEIVAMSRRTLTKQNIMQMGTKMIKVLTWEHRVIPPRDFLCVYLSFLPPTICAESVMEESSYLTELAVCDAALSRVSASSIALASIMNTLRATYGMAVQTFTDALRCSSVLNPESPDILQLSQRLDRLYTMSYESRSEQSPHVIYEDDGEVCDVFSSSMALRIISEQDLADQRMQDIHKRRRVVVEDDALATQEMVKRVKSSSCF